mmetsp:Transcript_55135/g.120253  ORF Transcript_55135/g.120253 Transcript_55135/m.120253 type:complete len:97 (+) Transcript_55135:450-740(+)
MQAQLARFHWLCVSGHDTACLKATLASIATTVPDDMHFILDFADASTDDTNSSIAAAALSWYLDTFSSRCKHLDWAVFGETCPCEQQDASQHSCSF